MIGTFKKRSAAEGGDVLSNLWVGAGKDELTLSVTAYRLPCACSPDSDARDT